MRLTEQIDALEVLGLSPLRELVGPRVLACMLALPPLTVFIAYLAILSGYVAEALGGSCVHRLQERLVGRALPERRDPRRAEDGGVRLPDRRDGLLLRDGRAGGTEGVGRAATRGVVASIFLVLVSNVFLVKLIQVVAGLNLDGRRRL